MADSIGSCTMAGALVSRSQAPAGPVRAHTVTNTSGIALLVTLAMTAAGCGRTQTADAQARDGAEKQVSTAVVVKDSVRRSIDVVGTLAAVDQVTISSETEGTVRAILADLGDRVTNGQVLVQIDNEKQRYTYEQQQATLARALAQYRRPRSPAPAPDRADP